MQSTIESPIHDKTRRPSHLGERPSTGAPTQPFAHHLQQQAGNRAVQQLVQATTTLSPVNTSEAEELQPLPIEATIARSPSAPGASACSCSDDDEETTPKTMCSECRQQAAIARRASGATATTPARGPRAPSQSVVSQMLRSHGRQLDLSTRAFFEPRFGQSLGDIRVHTDAEAASSASALHANAFTLGSDIWFGAGKYEPDTHGGRELLAHEMAHTVQQKQAGVSDPATLLQRNAVTVGRVDSPEEAEADQVARTVVQSSTHNAPAVSADSSRAVRGNWLGDAWDAAGDAASWVGDRVEDAGGAVVDAAEWTGGHLYDAGAAVAGGLRDAGGWAADRAEDVGNWAYGKAVNAWHCLGSVRRGIGNLFSGDIDSLTDLLGIEAPANEDPSLVDTLIAVIHHPCLQMLPGWGLVLDAVGVVESVGHFLVGAWRLIQNPQPVIDGIHTAISGMIAGIPAYVEGVVNQAIQALGARAREHGEGVWRHLQPKLDYLAANWWEVIKGTAHELIWPWPSVAKNLGKLWDHLKAAGNFLWGLHISKAVDEILAAGRELNSILGSLYGWFFIASVLVGAIIGAFFGGAGAIPGAAAGAAFAGEVGEGLLAITLGIESASLLKAAYNLLEQNETPQEKEADYEQISSSALTLAITGVMVVLSELAVKFAQGLLSRVAGLFRPAGRAGAEDAATATARTAAGAPEAHTAAPETAAPETAAPETAPQPAEPRAATPETPSPAPETAAPDSSVPDTATPETASEPAEPQRPGEEPAEPGEDFDPVTGEPVEELPNGGEARVDEDGRCEICHSPCQWETDMLRDMSDHLDRVRSAMADAPTSGRFAQLENLLRRLQLLEDSMAAASRRGTLRAEFNARFRNSFRRLSREVDAAYTDLFDPAELQSDAAREMQSWESDEPGSEFNDRNPRWDPERAYEGTAFHDVIQAAVIDELPAGSAFTENTIQDFFRQRGITRGIPRRSTGIDLYALDRVAGRVYPVDIINVAGGARHVAKLLRDFDRIAPLFEECGFSMAEPIEIEYVGQNFDEAAQNIANELRALAR